MLKQVQRDFTRRFGHFRNTECGQIKAHGLYSLERSKERSDLTQASKIFAGLAEKWGHRGALFTIRGKDAPGGNGKTMVREHVTTGFRGKPFIIRVVNGWNKMLEEVIECANSRGG